MRYVRRGLAVAGLAGVAVLVARKRARRADPFATPDPQWGAEAEPLAGVPAADAVADSPVAEAVPAAEVVAEAPVADPAPAHLAYLPHLGKYHESADPEAVRGIVRHCGIALRNPDASMVSAGDPVELARLRDSFLKKKLGLEQSDDDLDAAIKSLMERMTGDRAKSRVTVYYLLADQFGKLDLFR